MLVKKLHAYNKSQKYKVNKIILEKAHIKKLYFND